MRKTVTMASSFRVKAALCCSVAMLLAACGGTTDDIDLQQSLAATAASEATEAASAGPTATVDARPDAQASVAQENTMPDTATPAASAADGSAPVSNAFNLSGYQDATAASSSDAATQGAPAVSSADGRDAPQLPAA